MSAIARAIYLGIDTMTREFYHAELHTHSLSVIDMPNGTNVHVRLVAVEGCGEGPCRAEAQLRRRIRQPVCRSKQKSGRDCHAVVSETYKRLDEICSSPLERQGSVLSVPRFWCWLASQERSLCPTGMMCLFSWTTAWALTSAHTRYDNCIFCRNRDLEPYRVTRCCIAAAGP